MAVFNILTPLYVKTNTELQNNRSNIVGKAYDVTKPPLLCNGRTVGCVIGISSTN